MKREDNDFCTEKTMKQQNWGTLQEQLGRKQTQLGEITRKDGTNTKKPLQDAVIQIVCNAYIQKLRQTDKKFFILALLYKEYNYNFSFENQMFTY